MGWKYILISCSPNGTMGVETFKNLEGVAVMRTALKTQSYCERLSETEVFLLKRKQFVVKAAPGVLCKTV
jgi:hypothetical protein